LQNTIITFTEYASKSIEMDLGWALDDPHLDQLERLNAQSGDALFSIGRKRIKASQYVGLVRLGDITLQILPKIAYTGNFERPEQSHEHQSAVHSAMRNLLVMLSVACDLPLRAQDHAHLHTESGDWLEILTRLFALELHRQFQAGLPHEYVTIEDRLPVIRGRWLVGEQISRHAHEHTRFDVMYDEFSPDTQLSRIFALTVDALWRLTQDPLNRRLLLDLRTWLADCKPHLESLQSDLTRVQFTRLNERFRPAFNIAALFWEQRLVQLSSGDHPAFAFVFDMNRLFEDFIGRFLQRHQKRIIPQEMQDGQIVLQARGQKVFLAERDLTGQISTKSVFRLKPDILFVSVGGRPYLIGDTKYKQLAAQAADGGVSEGDAYQMLAYARRWNCPKAILIYPAAKPVTNRFVLRIKGAEEIKITVTELNLQQPLEKPDALIEELRQAIAFE
jgi:5-methylcytosine-specific restriction enzyme subunit McrC